MQKMGLATSLAVIAAFAYAAMSVFVKLIGESATTTMITFFRFSLSFFLLIPWFLQDPRLFKINRHDIQAFFIRSIFGLLALFCMFYSFKTFTIADGILLNNTNVLFVPIVTWIALGIPTPFKVWMMILVGFIGVLLILGPDEELFHWSALIGLASGLFGGVSLVQIRLLTKANSNQQILFYYFLWSSLITGFALIGSWKPLSFDIGLLLMGLAIMSCIYQICIVLSFTYAPVRLMSVVMFSSIVFGALFDWLMWSRIPGLLGLLGIILVIMSGAGVIYFGHQGILQKKSG